MLEVTDYGARSNGTNRRTVSKLTRYSNQPKVSRLLYNICRKSQPATILELGTSLGISTLSMAAAAPKASIVTIEGCSEIGKRAIENFRKLGTTGISLVAGDINRVLPQVLAKMSSLDLLFIDANHRYQPTMDYFRQCSGWFTPQSMVVIDDIYWSPEMTRAWCEIKELQEVEMTVDLFHTGVVLFRKGLGRRHYLLNL